MRLQNKVVLVTASTRGIGWEIVKACAKEGAVVYMAARNLEKAEAQAQRTVPGRPPGAGGLQRRLPGGELCHHGG